MVIFLVWPRKIDEEVGIGAGRLPVAGPGMQKDDPDPLSASVLNLSAFGHPGTESLCIFSVYRGGTSFEEYGPRDTEHAMRHDLRIAFRHLRRHAGHTAINVVGLAIGLAAAMIIGAFVLDELSYDRYHPDAQSLFRITEERLDDAGSPLVHSVMIDPVIAPLLGEQVPGVLAAARLTPVGPLLSVGETHRNCDACYWGDPAIFSILGFGLIEGSAANPLPSPYSIALSASVARALYGEERAAGKPILINGEDEFTVSAVFADPPRNSHLPVAAIGSLAYLEARFGELRWGSPNYVTYVRARPGVEASDLESAIASVMARERPNPESARLRAQRVVDIHLDSHLVGELGANGDRRIVWLFTGIALLILAIACINFVNLTTARASLRTLEVGVRKALGAGRGDLLRQFLLESALLVLIAVALAAMLAELSRPFLTLLLARPVEARADSWPVVLGSATLAAISAGWYPALRLSGFRPIEALRGRNRHGPSARRFRGGLVVLQLAIALLLLIGTLTVSRQLDFVGSRPLGYDAENLIVLPTIWDMRTQFEPVKARLASHPDIVAVTQSNPLPSRRLSMSIDVHSTATEAAAAELFAIWIDEDFFETYAVGFLAGRGLTAGRDPGSEFILNETALRSLGWNDPATAIGSPLQVGGWQGEVAGVVRDFHFESMRQAIAPMIFFSDPRNFRMISVRMRKGADIPAVTAFLEETWQTYEPDSPVSLAFLDAEIAAGYDGDLRGKRLVGTFALLALFLTGLGLAGLAAFLAEQRTKEMGIRKALGATTWQILTLGAGEVLVLVAIASAAAIPLAVVGLNRWLGGFAYHVGISPLTVALACVSAAAVAVLSVGYYAVRAARADPVHALRYE